MRQTPRSTRPALWSLAIHGARTDPPPAAAPGYPVVYAWIIHAAANEVPRGIRPLAGGGGGPKRRRAPDLHHREQPGGRERARAQATRGSAARGCGSNAQPASRFGQPGRGAVWRTDKTYPPFKYVICSLATGCRSACRERPPVRAPSSPSARNTRRGRGRAPHRTSTTLTAFATQTSAPAMTSATRTASGSASDRRAGGG
jgi:hypothetical protein